MKFQKGQQAYTIASGTASTSNMVIFQRDPNNNDITYEIGTFWLNNNLGTLWVLNSLSSSNASLQALWIELDVDLEAIETITGDSGGPVGPDSSNNINLNALYTNSVVGDPVLHKLVVTPTARGYPITPYVVGPSTFAGYQTIQSALDAANALGGGIIYIQPGNYTENLTLYDNTQVIGTIGFSDAGIGVNLTGIHTPPISGGFVFRNIKLISTTDIFSSVASGTAHLMVTDSAIAVTNGYLYNLLNWTGILETYDVNASFGTNDGFVRNTGGAIILLYSAGVGAGTSNVASISGPIFSDNSSITCPINFVTGANPNFDGCQFFSSITLSNDSTGYFDTCHFITGVSSSITMSSSGSVSITNSTIASSANPVIAGAGSGTLTLGGITFNGSTNISGTLTTIGSGGFMPGSFGTTGQVFTSNGPGIIPSFQAVSTVSTFNVQTFTTPGAFTYTPTAGMNYCTIECVGGGGGGGGSANSNVAETSCASGGGGGGYARKTVSSSTIGPSQNGTVAAGGAGGTAGNNNGSVGGTSSLGSTIVQATGGTGGNGGGASATITTTLGVAGGIGSFGDVNANGNNSADGFGVTGAGTGGNGGNSIYGGGGIGAINTVGGIGTVYGGGGGGAASQNGGSQNAGGDGASGIVIITEYI